MLTQKTKNKYFPRVNKLMRARRHEFIDDFVGFRLKVNRVDISSGPGDNTFTFHFEVFRHEKFLFRKRSTPISGSVIDRLVRRQVLTGEEILHLKSIYEEWLSFVEHYPNYERVVNQSVTQVLSEIPGLPSTTDMSIETEYELKNEVVKCFTKRHHFDDLTGYVESSLHDQFTKYLTTSRKISRILKDIRISKFVHANSIHTMKFGDLNRRDVIEAIGRVYDDRLVKDIIVS